MDYAGARSDLGALYDLVMLEEPQHRFKVKNDNREFFSVSNVVETAYGSVVVQFQFERRQLWIGKKENRWNFIMMK